MFKPRPPEGCQRRHGAGRLGVQKGVHVPVLAAGQVFEQQPDGVKGHTVADGVVPRGVNGLNGDAQLSDGRGDHDAQGCCGQGLPVDDDRAVRHALARENELAPQVMVGDAAPAAAELGAPHGGGHARYRQLGRGSRRHGYPVGWLEDNLVVVDVAALGQQGRHRLGGVVGAAAADADEDVGLEFLRHIHAGLHGLHRRVRGHSRVGAGVAMAQRLLNSRHHIARLEYGGAAGNHHPTATESVQRPGQFCDGGLIADDVFGAGGCSGSSLLFPPFFLNLLWESPMTLAMIESPRVVFIVPVRHMWPATAQSASRTGRHCNRLRRSCRGTAGEKEFRVLVAESYAMKVPGWHQEDARK